MFCIYCKFKKGIIFRRSKAANSEVSGEIWPSNLFMRVLVTSKYEKIQSIQPRKRVDNHFPHFKLMRIFRRSKSVYFNLIIVFIVQLKQSRKRGDAVFFIITLWALCVAMVNRILSRAGLKFKAGFPYTDDASDQI